MYNLTSSGTRLVMRALADGIVRYGTIGGTMNLVKNRLDASMTLRGELDVRSRRSVLSAAEGIVRKSLLQKKPYEVGAFLVANIEPLIHAFNQAHLKYRKQVEVKMFKQSIRQKRMDKVVFYLVSSHQNPAKGHEPLQGTVLVDAYWRAALDGDEASLRKVERYVLEKKPLTVQKAMGEPYWLITRPNCMHRLIPLPIAVVCGYDEKTIRKAFNVEHTRRPLTYEQRKKELQALKDYVLAYSQAAQTKKESVYLYG